MASYQDEGYSEDPLTMQLSHEDQGGRLVDIPSWISNMPVHERARFAMSIINGLPTASVAEIVQSLRPRLYINFFDHLPPEVCLKVLGYLDPLSLIRTAQASRDWMSLAMDWKLWQQLYFLEGWRINVQELREFEDELVRRQSQTNHSRPSIDEGDDHTHKKRATPKLMSASFDDGDLEMRDVDVVAAPKQQSIFGRPVTRPSAVVGKLDDMSIVDEKMSISPRSFPGSGDNTDMPMSPKQRQSVLDGVRRRDSLQSPNSGSDLDLSFLSSLVVRDRRTNSQKLNWQYLYAQRRRLEANWESEKYTCFQLPHPDFMEEAHRECIYTIQHSGRFLVSGSRDKTLRIWDLNTRRLVRPPLEGHTGSVLCLQFDADPAEDLIVSGSSDATVMLWKFSTGQLLQTLKRAHRESVLNVRFDHRILVTCSKDKTIKIFNRRPLHPGDVGYSIPAQEVNNVPIVLNNFGFNPSPYSHLPIKPAYSMIGCLEGHGAAVNAVQIYKNEIVSASGDRNVKVWDWLQQSCTRTFVGHQKGIACVQYDGRRIVSGSSDNEVKVFDKETGLEVASLKAHTNLVRTVQAGFGDLPYSAEEDQADARLVDDEYFKAVDAGTVPRILPRSRHRNAGSRRPEDIMAYGATLPPGGGGGKYGRIVSGSYDETVIIWRRDKEGVWKAQTTLRQEDAAIQAAREGATSENARNGRPRQSHAFYAELIQNVVPQGPTALRQAILAHPGILVHPQLHAAIAAEPVGHTRSTMRAIVSGAMARQQLMGALVHTNVHQAPQIPNAGPATAVVPAPDQQPQDTAANATAPTLNPQLPPVTNAITSTPTAPTPAPVPQGLHLANGSPLASQANTAQNPNPNPAQAPTAVAVPQPQAQGQVPQVGPPQVPVPQFVPAPSMARVFKLQFDARRIICCSQTHIIVGWDFANGDEKIIEASKFFAPVE